MGSEMEILSCKCGAYLTEETLKYVVDWPQTLLEPEQGRTVCPCCGRDSEKMEELDEDDIVKLLNNK